MGTLRWRTRVLTAAAAIVAACGQAEVQPGPTPSPTPTSTPETAAPAVEDSQAQPPAMECPEGAELRGAPPPHGLEFYCSADGLRHGPYRSWSADGGLILTGVYERGEKHGDFIGWHERGGPKAFEGSYASGSKEGPWSLWHPDGAPSERGRYAADRRDGLWTAFWSAGGRRYEITYVGGTRRGEARGWYMGGSLAWEGHFDDAGSSSGTWVRWHADGHRWAEGTCLGERAAADWRCFDDAGGELACEQELVSEGVPIDRCRRI